MEIPVSPNKYQGNQVIINSDRLIFNAKKDSILLYSDKTIGFSAKGNFHFDTDNSEDTKLRDILNQILDILNMMTNDVVYNIAHLTTAAGTPTGMNPMNEVIANSLSDEIEGVRKNIDDILSQNTKLV